ncbi:hypothetical protein [Streptomyces tropicalis]|uniref:Integral membrane protein n=1 Tax=Streptomyces tropicalis TaxID=3034234 RepID=A0ABT6ADK2_9ACTN|nr:hypothetical protein [Streptomyces tropicalis]MDF3302724.1 hypothetical protein [Streptomyces tropicalis]
MLALRLSRVAHPAVQLRRLAVAAASAGTGFLLLCTFGYALGEPEHSGAAVLRLSWCAVPLAATVYLALAVARTDPGTRPRPGLSALGLGPGRMMAVSAATTALACSLGSLGALLLFVQLRGGLRALPLDGGAARVLAAGRPLPVPATLTLLVLVPVVASVAVALSLRPRDPRRPAAGRGYGRFGAYGTAGARETFGAYGRFGARLRSGTGPQAPAAAEGARPASGAAGGRTAVAVPAGPAPGTATVSGPADALAPADGPADTDREDADGPADAEGLGSEADPHRPPAPRKPPAGLPWGVAVLAAGLAVEAYTSRAVTLSGPALSGTRTGSGPALPGGLDVGSVPVLVGWLLTTFGLALAGPGLTHLCGRLLQAVRPGPLRLLAGRALMEEAGRIGRPLGVVCAVLSGTFALLVLGRGPASALGPLTALGTLVVLGCTVGTLLTAAVEARQDRSATTAALVRIGAPGTTLRTAAGLRAAALLVLFGPLTLVVAYLSALPLAP